MNFMMWDKQDMFDVMKHMYNNGWMTDAQKAVHLYACPTKLTHEAQMTIGRSHY